MDVLREILNWSSSRPPWQRDALRRIVAQGALGPADIEQLAALCKTAHGLVNDVTAEPLEQRDLPRRAEDADVVALKSLTHHGGVNALAAEQTIEFDPALTVVYGANAAGKSGYTRILKRACRARGSEQILGNVFSGSIPPQPSATIRFSVGNTLETLAWNDETDPVEGLGKVSVFDSQCAAVYVTQATDVAFRPFGLDIFDKLSAACEQVRAILEREQRDLGARDPRLPSLPPGTAAHALLGGLTSLTDPRTVTALATLSAADKDTLLELRKRLQDLEAGDPQKLSEVLELRARRFEALRTLVTEIQSLLSDANVLALFKARDHMVAKRREAEMLRSSAFSSDVLEGTGGELWRQLWEAARAFSTGSAYSHDRFPVTHDTAVCVLCQQALHPDAAERLSGFEAFFHSDALQQADRATREWQEHRDRINTTRLDDPAATEQLRIEAEPLAQSLERFLREAGSRRTQALAASEAGQPLPHTLPNPEFDPTTLGAQASALVERASLLRQNRNAEARARLARDLAELEGREQLGGRLKEILDEIERKKQLAAYQLCLKDTNTREITLKSAELTKVVVTRQLARSFQDEIMNIGFRHLEVELQPSGGVRGALYHRLVLKRAPGVELSTIASEGEARTLSLGAFFTELSTATGRSAILFDDPVSSLDHSWRDSVARRLATEASRRQVIVFTHDVVFLLALDTWAKKLRVDIAHQYLRRETVGSGVCQQELPWVAMKVSQRLGVLRRMHQEAASLHRAGDQATYERQCAYIYGLLREAWERGVEEVLLGGVVERYRPSVQTQQASTLADITQSDCETLNAGMAKCSRWLPGHDQAAAESLPMPGPEELGTDIQAFEAWAAHIRRRRQ